VKTLTEAKFTNYSLSGLTVPTSQALTSARCAFITVEATNGLRYTFDGTDPVASTTGHLLAGGGSITIYGYSNIKKLKMIRDGGTDAAIKVSYFA
jgi:hypothetical protein